MTLLGANLIEEYKKRHPEARAALDRWRKTIEATAFRSIPDSRAAFAKSYDYVPPRCHVFDIAQGRHRLVAYADLESQIVKVNSIMDHARYDRWRCL